MEVTHYTLQLMPKKVLKKGTILIDFYKVNVEVYIMVSAMEVGNKVKQLCKLNGELTTDVIDEAHGYVASFPKDSSRYYLILCVDSLDINTITHETDHLRTFILSNQSTWNEETSANLNGFINEKVFKFLNDNKFIIK